ncbi:CRISPR-associated helicase Cas3' [Wenjunlia tyrosinilytica]|uniref:CRISPR-associated helicase/endonuclease Cas3 n=1 Tax=Wenjunlia tyrosinilytica TaxID=1544741 RepID=A0A917ZXK7_9ACTN|nr:CRISPR-associated helicase Cas3' [Wenjunlia tyrosinilytica]GGO98596.1 CRISPR-associated helicase/endonuclease Cas3 [Wenjunlia tyrosinilytica]
MLQSPAPDSGSDILRALGVLWGKSEEKAGGTKNLLMSHLLDTAAVAERMWDGFLAPSTKRMLDDVAGGMGRGRRFFAWLCGVHDCGKATPAFQRMWPKGAAAVRAAGLDWHEPTVARHRWRHDRAGGYLLRALLPEVGWRDEHVAWIWPLVAGHHGVFPDEGALKPSAKARGRLAGDSRWALVQRALVERYTSELGFSSLAAAAPVLVPSRATQLHLSGLIVMADWIASDEEHFDGLDELSKVSLEGARKRAGRAWAALGLRGGWGRLVEPGPEAFKDRFGQDPRASQTLVMETARQMAGPGLLVVEAPMGEGKTKAALLAAEILAARFGADGVFVGMPTQATSDPMFGQVRKWAGGIGGELASQVALLHGKRMFNKEWRGLVEGARDSEARFGGVDEYGDCCDDDPYGAGVAEVRGSSAQSASRGPAEWFLGAKRGLLCPFVVGTIDQLLFAATRTKHVMLRMAGLAGKVVVLDEVHAADVYMSQFLKEGLRWLGQAGVPVVLLSATLPPRQRRDLVDAYLSGAVGCEEFMAEDLCDPQGYPSVTAAWMAPDGSGPRFVVEDCDSWRKDLDVEVELMPERIPARHAAREQRRALQAAANSMVVAYLGRELADGGCALVIRNTVDRAQSLFTELRGWFGEEVMLLHGRMAVGPRAERAEECLRLLGAPGGEEGVERPSRLVVVATQLAEQSFDVDADLLVTDLAPIDLLLQRIGRLHRHADVRRPGRLGVPRVVITGFSGGEGAVEPDGGEGVTAGFGGAVPRFLGASEFIYGRYLLLRAAALLPEIVGGESRWRVPGQVPELVAAGYGGSVEGVPAAWLEDVGSARRRWEGEQRDRAARAASYVLTRRGDREGATLSGLHFAAVAGAGGDAGLDAVVRDGDRSVEVVVVVQEGGVYRTLSGRALTVNGDVAEDLLEEVLGGTVRLPARYTAEASRELVPLPGWLGHPRLRYSRALVLDWRRGAVLAGRCLRYDDDLGLVEDGVAG